MGKKQMLENLDPFWKFLFLLWSLAISCLIFIAFAWDFHAGYELGASLGCEIQFLEETWGIDHE